MKIQDSVIVITGGAQGLGKAMALDLAKAGASIALLDMNAERLEEAKQQCQALSQNANADQITTFICNVAVESEVEVTFSKIKQTYGKIDALINNAGILRDGLLLKASKSEHSTSPSIKKMSLDHWQAVIDVNLTGVFLCGREAAAIMVETQTPGCIINISSISRAGNIGQSNYSAAKAGVVALSTTWAKELARFGIRAMSVAPGFIETEMTGSMKPEAQEHMKKVIPLGRAGQAKQISQTISYILENDYLSGRVIEVDGGLRI